MILSISEAGYTAGEHHRDNWNDGQSMPSDVGESVS